MYPIYARIQALLGTKGSLYAYSDDVYFIFDPVNMAKALLTAALEIYGKFGFMIGWGPDGKKKLILPPTATQGPSSLT